jgi:cytoskeleton protein RodZ
MDGGVGATLRRARAQRGIELVEVEASTQIRVRFLHAIENEEWELLPGEVYVRTFLRTYASYLGLDDARLAEEYGRARGPGGPAKGLPGIHPTPPQLDRSVRRRRLSPRLAAVIAAVALVAVLVGIGLSSVGGGSTRPGPPPQRGEGERQAAGQIERPSTRDAGTSLSLSATAEVWVCLLDEHGRALIDGQILGPGSEMGPYRSGDFTVSLGNGAVTITLDGAAASIPQTPNPIGFSIDRGGALRELPESERPTCT